jgi:hypothetical protein
MYMIWVIYSQRTDKLVTLRHLAETFQSKPGAEGAIGTIGKPDDDDVKAGLKYG